MDTRTRLLAISAAVSAVIAAMNLRDRMSRWGATDEETRRTLPGDVIDPSLSPFLAELAAGRRISTRAITIDRPPAQVWPWIVQMGHTRAGFYSHDWVERLLGITYADGHSSTRIHPEFLGLKVGDTVPYHPNALMPVLAMDPPHYFHAGERLVLEPRDGGRATRVIARTTGGWLEPLARHVKGLGPVLWPVAAVIDRWPGELLHHYMETGMLKGIKSRAESMPRVPAATPLRPASPRARPTGAASTVGRT
jgi:hypothetical protein